MWITIQQEGNTRQSLHRTNQKLSESLTATLRFSLINLDNKTREKMQINDIHTNQLKYRREVQHMFNSFYGYVSKTYRRTENGTLRSKFH